MISRHLDVEMLWILMFFAPMAIVVPWLGVVAIAMPQGRIFVRAFVDRRPHGNPYAAYIAVNEAVVFAIVGICVLLHPLARILVAGIRS